MNDNEQNKSYITPEMFIIADFGVDVITASPCSGVIGCESHTDAVEDCVDYDSCSAVAYSTN